MDIIDRVCIGDLRALVMVGQGYSIESTAMILNTHGPCIRYRLKRLENAVGFTVYKRHRKGRRLAYLTGDGYELAFRACEVLRLMEVSHLP